MKASGQIEYEDDLVVVTEGKEIIYKGMEDYEPMKDAPWRFIATTKSGKGHYEYGKYKKYKVD